jgi:hypothetical protein
MLTVYRAVSIVALLGLGLGLGSGIARADEAACKAVVEAMIKQAKTPMHQKVAVESSQQPGRKIQSETIQIGDTFYMRMQQGQWIKRAHDAGKLISETEEAMQKSSYNCSLVRREAIDGQAADLYKVHSESHQGASDAEIWVSVASGLPLRQHTLLTPPNGVKMQLDVTYDYSNVKAPIPSRVP